MRRLLVFVLAASLAATGGLAQVDDHPPFDAESAFDIAVAPDGSIWVAGVTASRDFPIRRAWQTRHGGKEDAFVARLRPHGRGLIFATYLGGSDDDRALSVAVDGNGNGIVVGRTRSPDFPTRRALQPNNAGGVDAFVTRISPRGNVLASTYFGGSRDEGVAFVDVDGRGRPTIAGVTRSRDLPTRRAGQRIAGGNGDAFVARLSRTARRLQMSAYLGAEGFDAALDVVVDDAGRPWLAGRTVSSGLPGEIDNGLGPAVNTEHAPVNGEQTVNTERDREPVDDAFVASLSRSGKVRWVSRLAGSGEELGTSLARGPDGEIWLLGRTTSADFPVLEAIQAEPGGSYDVFLARLSRRGRVERSTYLGGGDIDFGLMLGNAIAVDGDGLVTMIGKTDGAEFPTRRALQPETTGGYDAWVARVDPASNSLLFSTYLGGSGHEFGLTLALDDRGRTWIAGKTGSADFPSRRSMQPSLDGDYDVWIGLLSRNGRRLMLSTFLGGSD